MKIGISIITSYGKQPDLLLAGAILFCMLAACGSGGGGGSARAGASPGTLQVSSENPRYFTNGTGNVIYLTGSHTWDCIIDQASSEKTNFDYDAYLDFLKHYNHNFVRLWTWEQSAWAPWSEEMIQFSPLPYERTGPGNALDGKPKFNVEKFSRTYFERLRSRAISAREKGIYVSVMLFQGFSIEKKGLTKGNPWNGHPFQRENNVNGIDGDVNDDGEGKEVHTLSVPGITRIQETYIRKVIDTLNDLDNILWEISNESHAGSTEWQYHMIRYIRDYEKKKPWQHPVIMTAQYPGENEALFNSPADALSPNHVGGYKEDMPVADGKQVIILDTDHLWGVGGTRVWVWKSFLRGHNPIYMDTLDSQETKQKARKAMGDTLTYARKMDLKRMQPRNDLTSTRFCLSNPGIEYLVYQPLSNTSFTVELPGGTYRYEWFDPEQSIVADSGSVNSDGTAHTFTSPFSGDAVLYLVRQ